MAENKQPGHPSKSPIHGTAPGSLAASEETFGLLINAVTDYAIFVLSPEGIVLTWNTGAERIHGYLAKEILGRHFSAFYTPEEVASGKPERELRVTEADGHYEEEGWRVRKDGSLFWANDTVTVLRDEQGTLKGFAKVTRDLTERRSSEEILRQSEERFRLMIEGVKDYAIFALDPQGIVATWNAGAERNKGYAAREIIGRHFSTFYPEVDIVAGKPAMELREATAHGRFEDTGYRVRKDGTQFWANVIITATRDREGRLIGFSKVTRDLTEQKKAADALQQAYQDLERRVEVRTAELAKAKNEAERALQAREEFFSIASHELRTPLTSLKLRAQMAQRAYLRQTDLSPDAKAFLNHVGESDEQLDRLNRLVEDMLDLTRLATGNLSMERQRVDLAELAKKAIDRMSIQLRQSGTPIELIAPGSVFASADPMRIEQVLTNLLTNVCRYAPGKRVEVRVARHHDVARIKVADQGPGIASADQAQVFNRYERLDLDKNISGLGIGLYLSRMIVKAHSGTIRVVSEPGMGATFVVELPAGPVGDSSDSSDSSDSGNAGNAGEADLPDKRG